MSAVVVVVVIPRSEGLISVIGVVPVSGVGPLAQSGLDEALGLAVGFRGVRAGAEVLESEVGAGASYLKDVGITEPTDVIKLGLETKVLYNFTTVPTTLVLGLKGRVEWVWVGALSKDATRSVLTLLN